MKLGAKCLLKLFLLGIFIIVTKKKNRELRWVTPCCLSCGDTQKVASFTQTALWETGCIKRCIESPCKVVWNCVKMKPLQLPWCGWKLERQDLFVPVHPEEDIRGCKRPSWSLECGPKTSSSLTKVKCRLWPLERKLPHEMRQAGTSTF